MTNIWETDKFAKVQKLQFLNLSENNLNRWKTVIYEKKRPPHPLGTGDQTQKISGIFAVWNLGVNVSIFFSVHSTLIKIVCHLPSNKTTDKSMFLILWHYLLFLSVLSQIASEKIGKGRSDVYTLYIGTRKFLGNIWIRFWHQGNLYKGYPKIFWGPKIAV